MSLQTYDIRNSYEAYGFVLADEPGTSHQRPLQPGDWVTPRSQGYGMVVAVSDPELLVLWSREPAEQNFNPCSEVPLCPRHFESNFVIRLQRRQ